MSTPESQTTESKAGPKSAKEARAWQTATSSASALFVFAIVAMTNYLAFRHYQRMDWTAQGMFTLSPKSKAVVQGLDSDIDVYVFMSRSEPSAQSTDELLKRYTALTQHLRVHHVDPDRDTANFKLLAQRFGVAAGVIETGEARADVAAVVAKGDKNWHVNREDLVSTDIGVPNQDGVQPQETQIKAEQALTGAIVQVTSGRAGKVCVVRGHGEWSLEESAERSLSGLVTALRHDNLTFEAFETLGQKAVPAGCDAVFVLGPLKAFSEPEAKLLFDYLRGGGNLLLALDPVIEHDQINPTGFETELDALGIQADRSLVIELSQDRLLSPNAAEFVVTEFGDHKTTRSMQHAGRVFVTLARSLSQKAEHPGIDILMRTSDKAFGKTNIAEVVQGTEPQRTAADVAGPVTLAVATQVGKTDLDEDSKTGGRLIVVGDSGFIQGPLLESPELSNFHLISAWTGWLSARPSLIEIAPKKIKSGNIVFTREDLWALFFRVALLIPGAAALLGIAVWLNRRA